MDKSSRKRRTDKEEREKIYKEMLGTGVEKTKKGLKRMMEKAENFISVQGMKE